MSPVDPYTLGIMVLQNSKVMQDFQYQHYLQHPQIQGIMECKQAASGQHLGFGARHVQCLHVSYSLNPLKG